LLTVKSFIKYAPRKESVDKTVDVPRQFKVTDVNKVQFLKAFMLINVTALGIVILGNDAQPPKQFTLTDFKLLEINVTLVKLTQF
jgi:hypothetical protein